MTLLSQTESAGESHRRSGRTGEAMITRRRILQAVLWQGLATGFRPALGQQSPRRKGQAAARKKASNDHEPVEVDQRLNELLAPVRDAHHLPGLVGGILTAGGLTAIGAVGIRKIGSPEPFQATDRLQLGSCGKAMTATVIGTLVDAGKLTWGSTIRDVFPDLAKQVHADFRKVTLSQLLTHRAGLPNKIDWWTLAGQNATEQRRSILTTLLTARPRHRPGSTYEYSGVGYTLAGLMAETVTGQPWEALVKDRLFRPLEMASADYGEADRPGTVDQPWGHREVEGEIKPIQTHNAPPMVPAGGVCCTMPDWARFGALHLSAARGQARLLKAATFRALHTPPPGFVYAGGWAVSQPTWAGGRTLVHDGTNSAWFVKIWLAPPINFGFLAATNQGGEAAQMAVDETIAALIQSCGFLVAPTVGSSGRPS
jgi:CubicO group peptidase (beta-lactamase class C family)